LGCGDPTNGPVARSNALPVREFVTQTGEKLVVLRERLLPLKPEVNLEQKLRAHFPLE
jgi:hypothetical protein